VVDAERVLLCANGHAGDLWPGLKQTIITPSSFQVGAANADWREAFPPCTAQRLACA
jgi:hypothetical protein